MGGSIRVVVKAENNTIIQDGWTNNLPNFVKNSKFFECDKQHISEYLGLNSPYTPRPKNELFSPDGYGLDVFDFDKKRIYTMQGYCTYDIIEYARVSLSRQDREENIIFRELWSKKYMGLMHFNKFDDNWQDPSNQTLFLDGQLSFNEAVQKLKGDYDKKFDQKQYVWFQILWEQHGWQYNCYEETANGATKMLADLMLDGYDISSDARYEWGELITEHLKNEE